MEHPRFKSYDLAKMNIRERHGLLLSSVAPRPIAWATTIDEDGNENLAPFSFFNIFSSNPPIVIFSPARRGRDNTTKHTYENVKKVPEVVINIVNQDTLHQMVLTSMDYPLGVSELTKAGLSLGASEIVRPSRVLESPVQLECRVIEVKELGTEGAAGNLIVAEVLKMHVAESVQDNNGNIDPLKMKHIGRLGGSWYCSLGAESLFELKADVTKPGVGFDEIPDRFRASHVLSGNDLAQLAMQHVLPDESEVNDYKLSKLSDLFIRLQDDPVELAKSLELKAKSLIAQGEIVNAWCCLLAFNP